MILLDVAETGRCMQNLDSYLVGHWESFEDFIGLVMNWNCGKTMLEELK